mgnify:CR=1 FL=1
MSESTRKLTVEGVVDYIMRRGKDAANLTTVIAWIEAREKGVQALKALRAEMEKERGMTRKMRMNDD